MTARTPAAALAQAEEIQAAIATLDGLRYDKATGQTFRPPTAKMLAEVSKLGHATRNLVRERLAGLRDSGAISLPTYLNAAAALDEAPLVVNEPVKPKSATGQADNVDRHPGQPTVTNRSLDS